ncbi:MAG: sigma 54-interacting transcriptional regulator [Myxococcales bacterium]
MPSVARLVLLFGPRRGVVRDIERRLVIGRSLDADLHLLDDKVSREHCAIEEAAGGHGVRDLGSRNGTYLNGERLERPETLRPGDQIAVGETVLVYEPDFEAMRARDGESTLVFTSRPAADARSASAGRSELAQAGELALRAAMAGSAEEGARLLGDALTRALDPAALAVVALGPGGSPKPLLARPSGAHLSVSRPLVELALRQGRPLAMAESQVRAEIDARTTRVLRRDCEVLCAPVFSGGLAVAAVCLARARPFDESEIALAGALAAAAGAALVSSPREAVASSFEPPVAESPAMREAMRVAAAAAQVPSTVLVRGETGTGKEVIARAIHALGPRARGPFVAINCGAIPAELAESELFGYEKGAFTGASSTRAGAFEQADGGTLFLDEIGELPAPLQVKLLRVLQERVVHRVGGRGLVPVDVRVIAATHRDLAAMVKAGEFREDLYWRLDVLKIELPPLRERREDVLPLAERFLARLSAQLGRRAEGFTAQAREALRACAWPGNARQLANAIERALVLKQAPGPIGLGDLPAEVTAVECPSGVPATGRALADLVHALEREQIVLALKRARGVKSAAAEALGISRPTLDRKIEEYRIDLFE